MGWLTNRRREALSDADAVHRVLAGDTDAFTHLVHRHQDELYRHIVGMGLDHDTALDLLQDAFVKAYDRLAECKQPAHFRAWMFRITRNLSLDYVKNVRRLTVPFSALPNVDELPALLPENEFEDALQFALAQLPAPMREAFLLKHQAEYTYEEIAAMTDASPSAVKMRVHRARETLREFMIRNGVHAA
jgi:RNA polymerase sigma-70 factor, ECF subfamily